VSTAVNPHALPAGTQIRDYTIVSVIGTGGFSIVYKALDNSLMREVAIKEYFPGAFAIRDSEGGVRPQSRESEMYGKGIESFLNEGKLLAQFDHPALVRVYRCWEERGTAYLAMKMYVGTTLRDAVLAGGWKADEASLRALLQPMCDALAILHASNCYHRDVAPDNIMLVDNGAPVLLDFGAARRAIESTQVFTAILKPGYAPIEQYGDGELKQGPWTDVYALAGVVHFTLCGRAPPTAISRILKDAMPRPREAFAGRLPASWLDALENALAVKPEQRTQSVAEFLAPFSWQDATESDGFVGADAAPATKTSHDAREPLPQLSASPDARPLAATTPQSPSKSQTPDTPEDDSTVVVPRRAADEQVAASRKPPPARAAGSVSKSPPDVTPYATPDAAPPGWRPLVWVAAVAAVVAAGALAWRLVAPSVVSLSTTAPATESKASLPPVGVGNDTSPDKKPSLPAGGAPVESPDAVLKPPALAPTGTEKPLSAPSAAGVANAPPRAETGRTERTKEATGKRVQKAASDNGDSEDASSASNRKRPARCDVLIERFQLGEPLSEADNRFIRESCK
jgi:hypothetical protein